MNLMPYARPQTKYVRSAGIQARYGLSKTAFYNLRNHANPLRRFPHPTLILGDTPLWSEATLAAWEAAQVREEAIRAQRISDKEAARTQRMAAKEAARQQRAADKEALRQQRIAERQETPEQAAARRHADRLRRAADKGGAQ